MRRQSNGNNLTKTYCINIFAIEWHFPTKTLKFFKLWANVTGIRDISLIRREDFALQFPRDSAKIIEYVKREVHSRGKTMFDLEFETTAFLAVMGFIAAFIDSVVGGGGLISTPALMWTGLPLVTVLGTNKVAATMGSLTSVLAFLRSGRVDMTLIKRLCPLSFVGSVVGVLTVRAIPPDFLRPLVVVMLVAVAVYSVVKKDWGSVSTYHGLTPQMTYLSFLVAFLFGFYDGFFGPGTGSFLLFSFLLLGFDFVGAAANARALNFSSNIAGLIAFSLLGAVEYRYAIPMGLAMIVGAFCGTKTALAKGAGYVRPLFIVVTSILIGKQLLDLFLQS